ncbi:MAG: hypothetical protein EB830_04695 [Nitrosopumilus sp. H13]|nr:MAG: hypothetical protein EB830_04695 [Nitrosopumilus sp. H13]
MQETERVVKSGDYLEIDGFHRYFGHAYAEGKNAKFPEPLVLCCSKKKGQKATKPGSYPHDIQ